MTLSTEEPLKRIFAYRALGLSDQLPQPLESFREALECLQSDRSYMAVQSGRLLPTFVTATP